MKIYVTNAEVLKLKEFIKIINDKFATLLSRKIAKAQYESMIRRTKSIRGYDR